ncbi:hypothetical protein IAU60_004055 [Kwoniella sp. DSM 27419]
MAVEPEDTPATLLATRSFAGTLPSSSLHNVSWSDDGQCLFITRKGVQIVTPHLTTALPPPPTLADPGLTIEHPTALLNEARRKAALQAALGGSDDENEGGEGQEVHVASSSKQPVVKVPRPPGGEVKLWTTGIEVDKDSLREDVYGWSDVGDESSAILREKDVTARQAIWSPSGLSDLGGCLLVVMTSNMQVSVYAPRNDPYTKQWDEIADLTAKTKSMLPSGEAGTELTEKGMLEMRSTCMQWSQHIPLPKMIGVDGSLLALANRAGKLALWSYGPQKRFRRTALIDMSIKGGWIADLAWSEWTAIGETASEARIAMALTDGTVWLAVVKRIIELIDNKRGWKLDVTSPTLLDKGDKRKITAIKWVGDVLVWTKAGSVHLFATQGSSSVSWSGVRDVKLERVGNWASANALGVSAGIQRVDRDTLLIVLNSLTAHVIRHFTTEPELAHPHDSLRPSLAMRDMFIEQLMADQHIRERWRTVPIDPMGWTAHTAGWAGSQWGSTCAWVSEPINFHNLDSATEGKRSVSFVMANLGPLGSSTSPTVVEALQTVIMAPPVLVRITPGRVLMPYVLHITSLAEPSKLKHEVLGLCQMSVELSTRPPATGDLRVALWETSALDGLRLRLVLAQWGMATFEQAVEDFRQAFDAILSRIEGITLSILLGWVNETLESKTLSSLDRQCMSSLIQVATRSGKTHTEIVTRISDLSGRSNLSSDNTAVESCPACGTAVASDGTCAKGHNWSRCSITRLLITHPHYRVCSTCPSISLLPRRHRRGPIEVDHEGLDHDYTRFQRDEHRPDSDDWVVQGMLEAAVSCIVCGGRWQRAV